MKTSTALAIAAGGAVVLGTWTYHRNIRRLQFLLDDIQVTSDLKIGLRIAVLNPSGFWSYPVPSMFINVFDEHSQYVGSLRSDQLQWIKPGVSFLYAWVLPSYLQLGALFNVILQNNLGFEHLILNGVVKIGDLQIPLDTEITQNTFQNAA